MPDDIQVSTTAKEGNEVDPPVSSLPDSRLTLLIHVHQYLLDTIKFSDQKAAFLFAFAVGILTLGYNFELYEHISGRALGWAWENGLSAVSLAFILLSAALSLAALLPRLWSDDGRGIVFFRHILLHHSAVAYASAIAITKDADLIRELSSHCYTLAGIAQKKFSYTKWALWAAGAGGILTLAAVVGLSRSSGAQEELESVDHSAAAVVAAFDLDLPVADVSQRAAVLGTELGSVDTAYWSARQLELLEPFRNGYSATIQFAKLSNPPMPSKQAASPPSIRPRNVGPKPLLPRNNATLEALTTMRQEATKILKDAHTNLVQSAHK